ncbi:MAG: chromosome segregation protein SMC [Candidatus Woesearchaeota archaeon]
MTRIYKISMKGFKSFGKRVDLEFNSNFNCVLGPNGSGKSNIMDAVCFVLGKGSAKGLRADKSANLIYNGGKSKKPAKEGEVSIYFDNSNKVFPTDEEYLKISRIIRQTGQSVYKINDKTRTRQQILELLSIANIDPDGYNIVLQGDIARLVDMSSLERRKIVEDISGITIYEDKKNKALNELTKAEEKINQAEIILKERETYLKELKKERDQALKFKEIKDNLVRSKATLCHLKIKLKNEKKEIIEKRINESTKKIEEFNSKIKALKDDISKKKEEIKNLNLEIENKGEKEQIIIIKEIEQLKIDIATNKTKISSNNEELQRIVSRKEQLEKNLKDTNSKILEVSSNKKNKEKEKESNDKNIIMLENKIVGLKKKHKLEDGDQTQKEIEDIDNKFEEKQKEILILREEQQNLFREKDKIDLLISSYDEKISKVKELEIKYKKEIENLKLKRDEFKKTTLELNKLISNDSSIAAQLGNARRNLNELREKHSKLEAKNSALKQGAADNIATKTILESKNSFGEVFGTISDLGEVENKYSQALSIAAGTRIKSLVVDNEKTASNCIKYLKSKKLGTATFLPLNKIKSRDEKQNISNFLNTNGVFGLAVDLVSFQAKFKKAFSFVFGSTIVIENIDVARRIGVGNIRMVTLDGDLIETSGAMQGGYRKKHTQHSFQEKELSSEINAIEKELNDYESVVLKLEDSKTKNEDKINQLRSFKSELEGEIIKMEKSLHLDSSDLETNQTQKKELNNQKKELDKKIDNIMSKISSINKEMANLKMNKQKLKDNIAKMKNPRVIAELNAFEQKKTQLREENITIDANIKNIDMQLKNILEPEALNTNKILSQQKKEESKFKAEVDNLKNIIKNDEINLKEKEKQQKEFYSKYKELFTKKDKLNEDLQKIESSIIKYEEQARTLEKKANVYSIEKAGISAEISTLTDENNKYKDVQLFRGKSEDELKREIYNFEKKMDDAGNINMKSLEVYDQINDEYNKLLEKRDLLKNEKEDILLMINEIETKKKDIFMVTFDKIDNSFRDMFNKLSAKGDAFIELENPENPFDAGLRIKVRISGKKFLDIRSLSGGEKTLTALAFIFAIQEFEPASFYVFDEVDAALDKKNSELLADLIKKYSGNAQYIIISHKDGVIQEAKTLYGVSMNEDGVSKVVTLKI